MAKKVLIVDDEQALNELFVIGLTKYGYIVQGVLGGSEALLALQVFHPDIILLDIMMEPMDGWETLSYIKANQDYKDIPVIMQTGKNLTYKEAEQYCFDIDYYLMKPVTPKNSIGIIDEILRRKEFLQDLFSQSTTEQTKKDIEKVISLFKAIKVTEILQTLLDDRYNNQSMDSDENMYGAREFHEFRQRLQTEFDHLRNRIDLII